MKSKEENVKVYLFPCACDFVTLFSNCPLTIMTITFVTTLFSILKKQQCGSPGHTEYLQDFCPAMRPLSRGSVMDSPLRSSDSHRALHSVVGKDDGVVPRTGCGSGGGGGCGWCSAQRVKAWRFFGTKVAVHWFVNLLVYQTVR